MLSFVAELLSETNPGTSVLHSSIVFVIYMYLTVEFDDVSYCLSFFTVLCSDKYPIFLFPKFGYNTFVPWIVHRLYLVAYFNFIVVLSVVVVVPQLQCF